MSERIAIKPTEHGVVRVLRIDLEDKEIKAFTKQGDVWPLKEALGATQLSADPIEIIRLSDLSEIGLSGYLEDGQGIASEDIDPLRARLDALTGWVVVIPTSAFAGEAQTLNVKSPLRHIATFNEEREEISFAPLPDKAATGTVSGIDTSPPPHQASVNRLIVLACLMALAIIVISITLMVAT